MTFKYRRKKLVNELPDCQVKQQISQVEIISYGYYVAETYVIFHRRYFLDVTHLVIAPVNE